MGIISNLVQFISGTKALASDVNSNFEALMLGHNDQENRVNSLETLISDHTNDITDLTNNKANKTGDETLNFSVADGTEAKHTVNKGQLDTKQDITTNYKAVKRQCVLSGRTDVYGKPNFLEPGTGLQIIAKASEIQPIIISFADGFDDKGAVDYIGKITSDMALTLPANTPCYIYADRNQQTGEIILGYSTVQPLYRNNGPSEPEITPNQTHWFSPRCVWDNDATTNYSMRMWAFDSAGLAYKVHRVFLGVAVTNDTGIAWSETWEFDNPYANSSKMPNISAGQVLTFNTVLRAENDGWLCVILSGTYKNGCQLFYGETSGTTTILVGQVGDDINGNTKWASMFRPIRKGTYFRLIPALTDSYEWITFTFYPCIGV